MADATSAEDASITFHVKTSKGQKYTFTLPLSTTVADLKSKLATEEYAGVPASAQRLIYSGKVLKDHENLATHNVKEGNTMHLVKTAASNQRQNPANQSSSTSTSTPPAAAGVPQNLASGTGNDPLAGLTGARYAGFAQLPNASMFQNAQTPEDLMRQLEDPNFQQLMRETMNNPQVIDMMINQNPQLRQMGPQARQILQSDHFRRLITDPQALRQIMQMQQAMGFSPFGGAARHQAFPAPGVTTTTEGAAAGNNPASPNSPPQGQQRPGQPNPFAAFGGPGGVGTNHLAGMFWPQAPNPAQQPAPSQPNNQSPHSPAASPTYDQPQLPPQNPFAALFNPALLGHQGTGAAGNPAPNAANNPFLPQNNPLLQNPEALNSFLQAMGRAGAGAGAEGGNMGNLVDLLGSGRPPSPPDSRPPEERFATQLRQLNEMGFYDFDRNVQALRRTGGNVNGAIEYLLSNP